MRIKTIVILIVTALLTIVLMQNREAVRFTFLFGDYFISKLVMLLFVATIAFILGWLVGRPKKIKKFGGNEIEADDTKTDTLSDRDREYLN